MGRRWIWVTILSMHVVFLGACNPAERGSNGPELYVEVTEDGSCFVREIDVACADVSQYLKSTLRISTATYIAVTPKTMNDATHEVMSTVIERLKDAGYKSVIGSITLEQNKSLQPIARENARSG